MIVNVDSADIRIFSDVYFNVTGSILLHLTINYLQIFLSMDAPHYAKIFTSSVYPINLLGLYKKE